jgi:hypothetical protein
MNRADRARRRGRGIVSLIVAGSAAVATVTFGFANFGAAATRDPGVRSSRTVLLVGDSLLHQAATGVGDALPGTDVVDASVPGSGLLGGPVDWSVRAAELVTQYHPDVVVVSFVGNYDPSDGTLVADSAEYYDAWAAAAGQLTDTLRASGARVDWVAQPPLRSPNFYGVAASRTAALLAEYRSLATEPGVDLVGETSAVAGDDGGWTERATVCGTSVVVRIADGVHFTGAGGDWWGVQLGRSVAHAEGLVTRDACAVMRELDPAAS